MTKIKLKILLACLCSVALILCALLLVVNVAIPKDLERQAEIAIQHEYGEYDPSDDSGGINFLSASVGYLEINNTSDDFYYLTETERAVLAFCSGKQIKRGEFYRLKGKNRDIVLATFASDAD